MDHATQGAKALEASDGQTALTHFTNALLSHPQSPDYFVQRSTAFTRLKKARYDLALKDAEYAVLLGQKRAKREKIQAAQQRRVVALVGLGRYGDAQFILQSMLRWRPEGNRAAKMEGDMWKAKIERKLDGLPQDDEKRTVTVKEYPDIELPSDSNIQAWLRSQLGSDGRYNLDWDNQAASSTDVNASNGTSGQTDNVSTTTGSTDARAPSTTAPAAPLASTAAPVLAKIRHEWFQNAQSVTVTLYAKGVPKDKAEIEIHEDSVSVSFPHPSNPSSTFTFSLDPLFALIDASASTWAVMSTKIELVLRKESSGKKWSSLEGTTPLLKDVSNGAGSDEITKAAVMSTLSQPQAAPSYPTSSRTGPKNWDKLATDLTAKKKTSKSKPEKKKSGSDSDGAGDDDEDSGVESEYGGDAVDGFFKKLYKDADDDTRRAMMKSYYESNGTALSTNWSDVGKGKVEEVKSKADD